MSNPIVEKISADIKEAMKAKDSERLLTLRSLHAEIKNLAIDKRPTTREVTDEDALTVIARGIKQRNDAFDQFTAAGRTDLADIEASQLVIWKSYLPTQLSEGEVRAIVAEVVAQVGATGKKDMGAVMKVLMPRVKGKADGAMVNRIVGEKLV